MSPSRRRAIGAVRGFAFRAPSPRPHRAPLPCAPRPRRAHLVRLYPPRPVAPLPPRHYTRALLGRRDGDIAPYRHYTRAILPPAPRTVAVRTARAALHLAPPPVPAPRYCLWGLPTAVAHRRTASWRFVTVS